MRRWLIVLAATALVAGGAFLARHYGNLPQRAVRAATAKSTVADAINEYGPAAEARLRPYFASAHVSYPPPAITLVVLKEEKQMELWADGGGPWVLIHIYPVLAASGGPGPRATARCPKACTTLSTSIPTPATTSR
jgi:hypothetical protein